MASLKDCIDSAVQGGQLTKEEGDALKARYDQLAKVIFDKTRIKGALIAELEAEAQERQRRALLTEMARRTLIEEMEAYRDVRGRQDFGMALRAFIENLGERSTDVKHKQKAILARAHSELEAALHEFRKGLVLGDLSRSYGEVKVRLDNVAKELHGEKTGDAAAAGYAKTVGDVMESLRVRYNSAGGGIKKLKNWGLPHSHNPDAILGFEAKNGAGSWVKYMMEDGRLDRDRMVHPLTGRRLSDDELREALEVSRERILTEGWYDREPSGIPYGKGALWKQHQDHRFIHFKTADKWLEYNRDFGTAGGVWDAITGHIFTMSRDIAAMEVFGPNPAVLLEYARQYARKRTYETGGNADVLDRNLAKAETEWNVYRGHHNRPVNVTVANFMAGARNVVTSASLGSAQLSAITDLASMKIARAFVGGGFADRSIIGMIGEIMTQHGDDRVQAIRSGLILDEAIHGSMQQARYVGTLNGRAITGWLADRTIALQGLSAWTQRAKHVHGLWLQGHVADHVGMRWQELPEPVRRMFDRHGFKEADWDLMRAARLYEPKPGAKFFRPNELYEHALAVAKAGGALEEDAIRAANRIAEKYIALLHREMNFGVPEGTLRSQAILTGGMRPGTLGGELMRSMAQFKGFSVVIAMLHGRRIAEELYAGNYGSAAYYAGALAITGTLLGAISMGLKDIAAGRDVRKWQDDKTYKTLEFWGAAALQGGGIGIWGDFLFADLNRFGGGWASTLAGPLPGRGFDLLNLTLGNAVQAMKGELGEDRKTNAGRELVRFLKGNTPILSSLWYLKTGYHRVLENQLQMLLDRDASAAFRRDMNKRYRDYHQGMWWTPGDILPSRWPEVSPAR